MNDVQKGLLGLILEIDGICERNGITYYLGGGTALGAVRHRGFLPWDDDADLYITRDNWKKLLDVIDSELAPDRELVCVERTPGYLNPIARYMDLGTTWVYQSQMFSGAPLGQHVEFLVLDPMPSSGKERESYLRLFAVYAELLTPWFVVNRNTASPGNVFDFERYSRYRKRADAEGTDAVLAELEAELYGYPDGEECEWYHLRHGVEVHCYSRGFFGAPKRVSFEGHDLPVAGHAERVLRQAYGDSWKRVPPVEEQQLHVSTHDLDAPYTSFQRDYFMNVDVDSARECNIAWKRRNVECLVPKERREFLLQKMQAACDRVELEQRFASCAGEGADGPSDDDLDSLYRVEKAASSHGLPPCTIADRVRAAGTRRFLEKGEYWKAAVLSKGLADPSERAFYEDVVSLSRGIDCLLDEGMAAEAAGLAHSAPQGQRDATPLAVHALVAACGDDTRKRELAEGARDAFPDYAFFELALALACIGKCPAEALKSLEKLSAACDDGLVALAAKEAVQNFGKDGELHAC